MNTKIHACFYRKIVHVPGNPSQFSHLNIKVLCVFFLSSFSLQSYTKLTLQLPPVSSCFFKGAKKSPSNKCNRHILKNLITLNLTEMSFVRSHLFRLVQKPFVHWPCKMPAKMPQQRLGYFSRYRDSEGDNKLLVKVLELTQLHDV